jgi:integrase/recombinase XerD
MRSKQGYSVLEALEHFTRKCKARNLSEITIKTYKRRLDVFIQFVGGETPMSTITKDSTDDFILYLKESEERNDITINSYLRDLRVFLYFCMEEGHTSTFKVKLPKVDKKIKETYTDNELQILLKKPNVKKCDFTEYKIWAMTNYLIATGNRLSSILSIKIGDLDFDNGLIQVSKTKNRKAQIIPMSPTLATVLKEYLVYRQGEAVDYLFCNTYGEKGYISTYQTMLANYNRARGVSKTSAIYTVIHSLKSGF